MDNCITSLLMGRWVEVVLKKSEHTSSINLEISFIDKDGFAVTYLFEGIADLKIGNIAFPNIYLEILDISQYFLEGLKYQVTDFEHGTFEFLCGSFSVLT